jgi:hypothetical protein
MAHDATTHVKLILGDLTVQMAAMRAENETLREQLATVTAERDAALARPNGRRRRKARPNHGH